MGWWTPVRPSRRATRWAGLGATTTIVAVAGGLVAVPVAVRGLVTSLELMVRGSVWLATSIGSGTDGWTIVTTIGRAVGLALATPRALGVFGVLLLVGAVALLGLTRLLDSEEESAP
jgi:hypothetical protein